jgi:hypothetical protein
VSEYDTEQQKRMLRALGFDDPDWRPLVALLAAGATLSLLLIGALLFRTRCRPDPVAQLWQRFCGRLARAGAPRAPHEGPLDFTLRAAGLLPGAAEEIREIGRIYAELRYARASPARARELARRVRGFRRIRPASA